MLSCLRKHRNFIDLNSVPRIHVEGFEKRNEMKVTPPRFPFADRGTARRAVIGQRGVALSLLSRVSFPFAESVADAPPYKFTNFTLLRWFSFG